MIKVNRKNAIIVLIGLLAFFVMLRVGHDIQAKRNAAKLLELAETFGGKGRADRELEFLDRYLYFMPNDTDALAKYGILLGKKAESSDDREQAILTMERVLRSDPKRHDVRRRLARLALASNRHIDVRAHAMELLAADKNDAEAQYLLGCCEEADGQYAKAEAMYTKAKAHAPKDTRVALQLAFLLRRRLNAPDRADKIMDEVVAADPRSFEAYFERSLYRREFKLEGAEKDALRAVELAPANIVVLLLAANYLKDRSDWKRAREYLDKGLKQKADEARLYRAKAEVEAADGRPERAEQVLRRGLEVLPEDDNLKWLLAGRLIEGHKLAEAGKLITELDQTGYLPELVRFLEARMAMANQQWPKAADTLEKIRPLISTNAELSKHVNVLLVDCYERQGKTDQLKSAYHRMMGADPNSTEAQIGYAQALESIGKYDDALTIYNEVKGSGVKVAVARLMILRNLGVPGRQQRWDEVARALDEAALAAPDSPQIPILRMEALAAQDKFDEAQALIEKARTVSPKQVELWLALAALLERRGATESLPPMLDEAQRALGDRVELRLVRARYYSLRRPAGASRLLGTLAKGLEKFAPADQERLILGLAQAHYRIADHAGALAMWKRWAGQRPDDVNAQFVAFDLAVKADDEKTMVAALERIRLIEGEDSSLFLYGNASRLIWKAEHGDQSGLPEARRHLSEVALKRPNWARVPLSEAKIDELIRNSRGALENYLRAVDLGERDLEVVRRTVELLFKARRYADAGHVLAKLQDFSSQSSDLQRYAAEIYVQNQDYNHALNIAQNAVKADSKDYRDHVWLGQILAAVGRQAEAERSLRRGVELAGDEPAPWVVLVNYLASLDRRTDAEAVVGQAEAKLTVQKHPLALAQCHEQIGHKDRALELYRSALAAKPDDETTLRNLVGFLVRNGRLRAAEPYLEKLIAMQDKSADAAAWAQLLARVLSAEGDPEKGRKAMDMLGITDDGTAIQTGAGAKTSDQLRAQAIVLINQKNKRRREEGILILEKLIARDESPADRFMLAKVHEDAGEWAKAKEAMLAALNANGKTPATLATYVQALLRHKEEGEAGPWLADLDRMAPGAFETAQLRAWVLNAQGQTGRAVRVLETFGDRYMTQRPYVAMALEQMKQDAAALDAYRKYASESTAKDPAAPLKLAQYLGRHGRLKDALDVCEAARPTCPAAAIAKSCTEILSASEPDAGQLERVGKWFEDDLRKKPADKILLAALANVRYLQERYQDSELIYRQALAQDSNELMVLSNLAWLLAHEGGKEQEARELIDRALDAAQPAARPGLLDTRAVIYMASNQSELAIKDLEEAIATQPNPVQYFHLAQAYKMVQKESEAREAIQKGITLGLKTSVVDPIERPAYNLLLAQLGQK